MISCTRLVLTEATVHVVDHLRVVKGQRRDPSSREGDQRLATKQVLDTDKVWSWAPSGVRRQDRQTNSCKVTEYGTMSPSACCHRYWEVHCLGLESPILNLEAECCPETSVPIYQNKRCHKPKYNMKFFLMARQPLVGQGLVIVEASQSHSDTRQTLGLLWTSDQPDAKTSTWQHTTLTRNRHPCHRLDSNPQSQKSRGRRPTP